VEINYYIDESGHSGDVAGNALDFGGQPVFALACIGVKNISDFEDKINSLKREYKIQADELKSTKIYNKKPKFITELFKYIELEEIPYFVEIVDKKYFLAINLVNSIILPPYFSPIETIEDLEGRRWVVDYVHENFPENIFIEFIKVCKSPSESSLLTFVSNLKIALKTLNCEESKSILEYVTETFDDDYYIIKKQEGDSTYKKFLPIPDSSKKNEKHYSILPNLSSFTNIYARINLLHEGNISFIKIIHDEQVQLDEILIKSKNDAESLNFYGTPTPSANYDFKEFANLSFGDSQKTIGIQVADLLAGFFMRYVSDTISNNEICEDNKNAFSIAFRNSDESTGIGINLVASSLIVDTVFGCQWSVLHPQFKFFIP
jgi:hypothetical protein